MQIMAKPTRTGRPRRSNRKRRERTRHDARRTARTFKALIRKGEAQR